MHLAASGPRWSATLSRRDRRHPPPHLRAAAPLKRPSSRAPDPPRPARRRARWSSGASCRPTLLAARRGRAVTRRGVAARAIDPGRAVLRTQLGLPERKRAAGTQRCCGMERPRGMCGKGRTKVTARRAGRPSGRWSVAVGQAHRLGTGGAPAARRRAAWSAAGARWRFRGPARRPCSARRTATRAGAVPRSRCRTRRSSRTSPDRDGAARRRSSGASPPSSAARRTRCRPGFRLPRSPPRRVRPAPARRRSRPGRHASCDAPRRRFPGDAPRADRGARRTGRRSSFLSFSFFPCCRSLPLLTRRRRPGNSDSRIPRRPRVLTGMQSQYRDSPTDQGRDGARTRSKRGEVLSDRGGRRRGA